MSEFEISSFFVFFHYHTRKADIICLNVIRSLHYYMVYLRRMHQKKMVWIQDKSFQMRDGMLSHLCHTAGGNPDLVGHTLPLNPIFISAFALPGKSSNNDYSGQNFSHVTLPPHFVGCLFTDNSYKNDHKLALFPTSQHPLWNLWLIAVISQKG